MLKAVGKVIAVAAGVGLASSQLMAAEVSLISGLYKKEDTEVAGRDAGGKSSINVGGRYSDKLDGHMYWWGQGDLTLRSFDAASGGVAPSDSTSLALGGGVRYYFAKLTENTSTFIDGGGFYRNTKDASITSATSYTENEESGLYYGASLGFRINANKDWFFDFMAPLFDSALFATETKNDVTVDQQTNTKTETETKTEKMELWASSFSGWNSIVVGIGAKL